MPGVAVVVVILAVVLAGCAAPASRPDVVLIVVDTLRADHLPDWGYDRATTGSLQRYLRHATRFDRCYAPSSWTLPSSATILTGLHPLRHGASNVGTNRLNPAIETLPEILHAHGWSSAAISFNPHVSRKTQFDQGFDVFLDVEGDVRGYPDISQMIGRAIRLSEVAPRPLLLYLQPMNTHGPYRVPAGHRDDLLGRAPSREFRYLDLSHGLLRMRQRWSQGLQDSLVDQYDTAIRYTMDQLAQLIGALEEAGIYDDALVIVTSDHGEELFDHSGFSHGYSLYEEVVRVPLYVKLPGQRTANVVAEPVSLADLMPTVLEVLDLPGPTGLDGVSLRLGSRAAPRRTEDRSFVFTVDSKPEKPRCSAQAILRWPEVLIHTAWDYRGRRNAVELFDLSEDPAQERNLLRARPRAASGLRRLLGYRLERLRAGAVPLPEGPDAELDRETLEALGYL